MLVCERGQSHFADYITGMTQDIAIVEPRWMTTRAGSSQEAMTEADPRHCVLLRAGGLLSVLDMDQVPQTLHLIHCDL